MRRAPAKFCPGARQAHHAQHRAAVRRPRPGSQYALSAPGIDKRVHCTGRSIPARLSRTPPPAPLLPYSPSHQKHKLTMKLGQRSAAPAERAVSESRCEDHWRRGVPKFCQKKRPWYSRSNLITTKKHFVTSCDRVSVIWFSHRIEAQTNLDPSHDRGSELKTPVANVFEPPQLRFRTSFDAHGGRFLSFDLRSTLLINNKTFERSGSGDQHFGSDWRMGWTSTTACQCAWRARRGVAVGVPAVFFVLMASLLSHE
eukprot:245696-Rhodomonas_salina.1